MLSKAGLLIDFQVGKVRTHSESLEVHSRHLIQQAQRFHLQHLCLNCN